MIPHHHHHDRALDSFSNFIPQVEAHAHGGEHGHHHHHHSENNESDNTHSHSFPPHDHSITAEDYSISRLVIDSGTTFKVISFIVLFPDATEGINDLLLNDKERGYQDKPFLIKSLFQPGAIGLRAPPCMA